MRWTAVSKALALVCLSLAVRPIGAEDLALLHSGALSSEEQAAYAWALSAYDARLVSFESIAASPGLLESFRVLWWHLESSETLPRAALDPPVIEALWSFVVEGGGLLLSGFSTRYSVHLGLEDTLPTEISRDPKITNDWGFLARVPSHPIFRGLENPFATVSSGLEADNNICWWVDPADFDGRWLGDVEWSAGLMTCGEWTPGSGRVVVVGAGAFEWDFAPQDNLNRSTLEAFTSNIIDYLGNIPETDVIAWWPLDDVSRSRTRDEARLGYDPIHGRFRPEAGAGVHGQALLFDGQSTYITSTLPASEQAGSELTIEAWVAVKAYPVETAALVNQHDLPRGFGLFLDTYGYWNLSLSVDGAWRAVFSPSPLPKFEWHHIAGTFDATGLRLYLDGHEVAFEPLSGGQLMPAAEMPLEIGRHQHAGLFGGLFPTGYFHGLLDDIRLYRRAPGPEEIQRHRDWALPPAPPSLGVSPTRFALDRHRPRFHPLPPNSWTNEPHGPIFRDGRYHVFYQTNPAGQFLYQSHWGHMTSENLVDWIHLPHAIWPERDGADARGAWSGDTAIQDDSVVAVYTSNAEAQTQSLATADGAELIHWRKYDENPVTGAFPPDVPPAEVSGFRDPCLFRLGGAPYMIVGSGRRGQGGFLPLYRSDHLQGWEYRGRLFEGDLRWGEMWEMPAFFEIATGTWVLFVNPLPDPRPLYWIGRLEGERFVPQAPDDPQLLDKGHRYLSPSVTRSPDGRWLAFGVVPEDRAAEDQLLAGWSNLFGLPRELTLQAGFLGQWPAREVSDLREEEVFHAEDIVVAPGGSGYLPGISGEQLEIRLRAEPLDSETVGLVVRRSPGGEEETRIGFNRKEDLFVVREKSSLASTVGKWTEAGAHPLGPEELLDLRIFLDHSVLAVFANGRNAITTRIYPARIDSLGLDLYTFESSARIVDLRIWSLRSARHGEWWPAGPAELPPPPDPPPLPDPVFRRGDANSDGSVDLSDGVAVLSFLFLGEVAPSCPDAADADDSGRLDISDAIRILGFLFLGDGPLPLPGPEECGEDPSPDELPPCGNGGCPVKA